MVVWTVKRGMRSFILVSWQCTAVSGLFLITSRFRLRNMLGCKHNISDEMVEKITSIILHRHFTSTGHQWRWAPSKSGAAPSTVIHDQTLQSLHQLWLNKKSNTRSYLWYFLMSSLLFVCRLMIVDVLMICWKKIWGLLFACCSLSRTWCLEIEESVPQRELWFMKCEANTG